MNFIKFILLCAAVLLASDVALAQQNFDQWFEGRATFYGGADAAGTQGGACGYKNLYQMSIGINNAAAASVLWKGGMGCGGCFEVKCNTAISGKYCIPGKSITITVTNMCPRGGVGWCNPPNKHFDMSQPAYTQIAIYKSGVVATLMRRVRCKRRGNIQFLTGGNPWFLSLTIFNVADYGEIAEVEAQVDKPDAIWWKLNHNWGAVFSKSKWFYRVPVNIRITSGNGKVLFIKRALPSGWNIGSTYSAGQFSSGSSERRRLSRRESSEFSSDIKVPSQIASESVSRSLGFDVDFEDGSGAKEDRVVDGVDKSYTNKAKALINAQEMLEHTLEQTVHALEDTKSAVGALKKLESDFMEPILESNETVSEGSDVGFDIGSAAFSSYVMSKYDNIDEVKRLLESREHEEDHPIKENAFDAHFNAKHQAKFNSKDIKLTI